MENKNEKKTIWLYAVILFSSAFIVLLLTAYSQMKIKNNANEYQSQILNEKKSKKNVITDLKTAQDENDKLNIELSTLKKEKFKVNADLELENKKYEKLNVDIGELKAAYNNLMIAQDLFNQEKIVECATTLLKKYNYDLFDYNTFERYKALVDKTFQKSSWILFNEGKNFYIRKNYQVAIEKLKLSLQISKMESYSDDCYYYLAYSEYRKGNMDGAKSNLEILIKDYSDSNYKNDAIDLISELNRMSKSG